MDNLREVIENAFDNRQDLNLNKPSAELADAIEQSIGLLDGGEARVAEPNGSGWKVNEWLKKAVLLYFATESNQRIDGGYTNFFDKVPVKFSNWSDERFGKAGIRVVPGALARKGAYIARNVILMPSYINIGAYVDSGTLVDTWATVGSCAQIGKNVHISGGAGIGGVLEPLQASPTIIEDDCFIGARSEIVEGVIVERGAVISMGVFIGQSTRIYDREKDEVIYGRVPAGAVVVPGNLPSSTGDCSLYAAIIVKRVDEKTRAKVSINELLREE
jgi:2,3,4,5-tetrahydropyridine-2-carboxylate N-succinyltransferase